MDFWNFCVVDSLWLAMHWIKKLQTSLKYSNRCWCWSMIHLYYQSEFLLKIFQTEIYKVSCMKLKFSICNIFIGKNFNNFFFHFPINTQNTEKNLRIKNQKKFRKREPEILNDDENFKTIEDFWDSRKPKIKR